MTTKNRKIIIGTSISVIVISIAYLLYKRNVNKKNSELMSNYIDELPKINTQQARSEIINKITDTAIEQTSADIREVVNKYNPPIVILDNKPYNLANPTQRKQATDIAAKIVSELWASMKGLGTDTDSFNRNFKRIGSYSAFTFVNAIYKSTVKEDLWAAIKGENKLYMGSNPINSMTNFFIQLPNFTPTIANQAAIWQKIEPTFKKR